MPGLVSQPVHEPLQRVEQESERVAATGACAAGAIELPVVLGPGEVVVVAEQVGARRRHAMPREDRKLRQASGPPVAVPEGVDPRDVEVHEDRAENGGGGAVVALVGANRPAVPLDPPAESLEKEGAVLAGGSPVAQHAHRTGRHLPGDDARFEVLLESPEQTPVRAGDPIRRERRRPTSHDLREDVVDGRQNVVDLPPQVLLRPREPQPALQLGGDLLLAQRVALDCGRGPRTLDQVESVHRAGVGGWQDRPSDLIAPGGSLAEQGPVEWIGAFQVVSEADPGVGAPVFSLGRHRRSP